MEKEISKKTTVEPGNGMECVNVDADNETLTVVNLKLGSRDSFLFFSQLEDDRERADELRRVIDIGVFVVNRVKLTTDTEFFNRRTEELLGQFSKSIDEMRGSVLKSVQAMFDPHEVDSYSKKLNDFFDEKSREFNEEVEEWREKFCEEQKSLGQTIEQHFDLDRSTSSIARLKRLADELEERISKKFDPNSRSSVISMIEELLDKRISVTDEESGLFKFLEKIKGEIAELREHLTKILSQKEGEAIVVDKSIHKGPIFQELVRQKLEAIAQPHGDLVEDVSHKEEEGKAKKGDFNYSLNSQPFRLVIEAKDTEVRSLPETLRILGKAVSLRNGHFGIFVVADEDQLPKQVGLLQVYEGDKIITCFNYLEVAIKVAKAYLAITRVSVEGIDGEKIRQILESIETSCRQLSMIKKETTVITKSSAKIELLARQVELEIKEALSQIEEELQRTNDSSEEEVTGA